MIESGTISFIPQAADGTAIGIPIIGGHYEIAADRGLLAGDYRVEVRWQKPTGKTIIDSDNNDEVAETIEGLPPELNTESTLTVTIEPGNNVFDVKR